MSALAICYRGSLRTYQRTDFLAPQPFTNDFPRADIHELLSPNILHQLIKGTFKDHLVDWVEQYINKHYYPRRAKDILADIDRR